MKGTPRKRVPNGVRYVAMGQKPVPLVNIPIPIEIGSKMGGEFTYQPKWDPIAPNEQKPMVHMADGLWVLLNGASGLGHGFLLKGSAVKERSSRSR